MHFAPARLFLLLVMVFTTLFVTAETPGKYGENVQFRGSYNNSRLRFERDKKGTVAFLGGSITEMEGYRPMVCEGLKKRFPGTEFNFIAAGMSSTCSTTGAFRLASDVLDKGPIDLFFVEFAVNDDQDAHHTREECIRGMEGIIRHIRQANPNVDIVMTFFVNEGMLKTLQDGKVPLTMEAHEAVAKHEAVSTIRLGREVADQITANKLTWKKYGGVHPAPFGNAIAAGMIEELFDRAWAQPLAADAKPVAHKVPEPVLDPLNYSKGKFLPPSSARIVKGWELGVPDWNAIPGSKRARFNTVPALSATEPGAEAVLEFEGTTVGAFVVAGPDAGSVEASVDDGPAKVISIYHSYSAGLHYPRSVVFGTDLKPGKHVLKLRISGESEKGGHAARILQFEVNG